MEGEAASGEQEEESLRTRSEGDEFDLAEWAWVHPQSARRGPGALEVEVGLTDLGIGEMPSQGSQGRKEAESGQWDLGH